VRWNWGDLPARCCQSLGGGRTRSDDEQRFVGAGFSTPMVRGGGVEQALVGGARRPLAPSRTDVRSRKKVWGPRRGLSGGPNNIRRGRKSVVNSGDLGWSVREQKKSLQGSGRNLRGRRGEGYKIRKVPAKIGLPPSVYQLLGKSKQTVGQRKMHLATTSGVKGKGKAFPSTKNAFMLNIEVRRPKRTQIVEGAAQHNSFRA